MDVTVHLRLRNVWLLWSATLSAIPPSRQVELQMSERPSYCWIVTCKNHLFHQQREYLYFRHPYITHRIPPPRPMRLLLFLLSMTISWSSAMNAEQRTPIHPLRYAGRSKNFLSPSRHIRFSNEWPKPSRSLVSCGISAPTALFCARNAAIASSK